MSWASAIKERPAAQVAPIQAGAPPSFELEPVEWDRLVSLDFETYFDDAYTLRKLSTSEYIRDPRFKAQCVAIKIGRGPTKLHPAARIRAALAAIPWGSHSLLCHHTQFDGFILSHHYGIQPKKNYCTLSMARALHSQDIGGGLDEVARYYGGKGKHMGVLEQTKGIRVWPKPLLELAGRYCLNDVDEMFRIFELMLPKLPRAEFDLIDVVVRMFNDPVLKVDLPRVQAELDREIAAKKAALLSVIGDATEQTRRKVLIALDDKLIGRKKFAGCTPEEILLEQARTEIGSNDRFADLLRGAGIEPPIKLSPAWMDKPTSERDPDKRWAYAFAKTDLEFMAMQEHPDVRVRALVDCRLAVKSTLNETRAARFLKAGENGANLPVYLKYGAAHTHRLGGGNRMNMQNLVRGSELRKSIMARRGEVLVVADSGQIEARTNAWLWGQADLLQNFRIADAYEATQELMPASARKVATGNNRDAYCKFADKIYGREITKKDKSERFVGKVCVLALGYQMGAPRLQTTLALGMMGPPVFLDGAVCQKAVNLYRRENHRIKAGWDKCTRIIEDMAAGRTGSWKCISWAKEVIYLPNGMTLRYPGLRNKSVTARVANVLMGETDGLLWDEWVYTRKGDELKIYGGLLCENLVQALARIIVCEQLLAIARRYRVVMTTHDEVVAAVKKALGQKAFDFMKRVMSTPLDWCPDIPLSAEGGFDVVYSK